MIREGVLSLSSAPSHSNLIQKIQSPVQARRKSNTRISIKKANTLSMSIASPINLILLSLFVFLIYWQLRPKAPVCLPEGPPPVVFRTFTPTTLLPNNGLGDNPVYLAVRGRVFDVTPGKNFYGPVCLPTYLLRGCRCGC